MQKIELSTDKKFVYVKTNIRLSKNGDPAEKKVGERTQLDKYPIKEFKSVVETLEKEYQSLEDNRKVLTNNIALARKKVNPRESAKLKEFMDLQQKLNDYTELKQLENNLSATNNLIKNGREQLEQIKAVQTELDAA